MYFSIFHWYIYIVCFTHIYIHSFVYIYIFLYHTYIYIYTCNWIIRSLIISLSLSLFAFGMHCKEIRRHVFSISGWLLVHPKGADPSAGATQKTREVGQGRPWIGKEHHCQGLVLGRGTSDHMGMIGLQETDLDVCLFQMYSGLCRTSDASKLL